MIIDIISKRCHIVSDIIPFDAEIAAKAGALITQTKPLGLSLGDRACLATAKTLALPTLTTDKAWLKLKLNQKIICAR